MISIIFGKKRIKKNQLVSIYTQTIYEVVERVFPEIVDFLNHQKHFKKSPEIKPENQEWFSYLIFTANILNMYNILPQDKADDLKLLIIRDVAERFSRRVPQVAEDIIVEYEKYLEELIKKTQNIVKATALAMFYKFELNECQIEHYQKINQPDPVFFKQLCEMTELLFWNWEDFLQKYKVV